MSRRLLSEVTDDFESEDDSDQDFDFVGPPLAEGTALGRLYRIVRLLGRGGQGDVYEVEHVRLGSRFAAKVLHGMVRDPKTIARFEREAIAASRLEHPNIARVINFDETEDHRHFAIMELLRGEDLSKTIARGPISVERTCELAIDVTRALEAAHASGVVHRDLKPSNLFLAQVGSTLTVKLTDFGISKVHEDWVKGRLTRTGAALGTPMYMSPEQAGGMDVDHRADLYALGLVMLEMLSGRAPFPATNALRLIFVKTTEPSPDPSEVLPAIPSALAAIIRRAIARAVEDRYASAQQMREAIEAFLSKEPKTSAGWAVPITVAGAVAVAGLAVIMATMVPSPRPDPPAMVAPAMVAPAMVAPAVDAGGEDATVLHEDAAVVIVEEKAPPPRKIKPRKKKTGGPIPVEID